MVSHLNSFKYVEVEGEFHETPSQNFEIIPPSNPVTKVAPSVPKVTRVPPTMDSLKDAKGVIEEGGVTIWFQIPDVPYKFDNFGLGFTSQDQRVVRHARANSGRPPNCFTSAGVPKDQVNVVGDEDSDYDMDGWIFPTTGKGLTNWTAKEFIPFSFYQE